MTSFASEKRVAEVVAQKLRHEGGSLDSSALSSFLSFQGLRTQKTLHKLLLKFKDRFTLVGPPEHYHVFLGTKKQTQAQREATPSSSWQSQPEQLGPLLQAVVDEIKRECSNGFIGPSGVDGASGEDANQLAHLAVGREGPPRVEQGQVLAERFGNVAIVTNGAGVEMAVQELVKHPVLALDCEGQNLSRTGRICLIQMATPSRVFLFDLVVMSPEDLECLKQTLGKRVLEHRGHQKVVHDCRQDSAALWHQLGIQLCHVFDTQAAEVQLEGRRRRAAGALPGQSAKLPSLMKLVSQYAPDFEHSEKSAMRSRVHADPDVWLTRPLGRQLITYAAADVACLFAVREGLLRALRGLVETECISAGDKYAQTLRLNRRGAPSSLAGVEHPMLFNEDGELVPETHAPASRPPPLQQTHPPEPSCPRVLLDLLPPDIAGDPQLAGPGADRLQEVVLDLGAAPVAWFYPRRRVVLGGEGREVDAEDIAKCVAKVGRFGRDNRAGIEGTLHRISALRNRDDEIVGLTFRVGRTVPGCAGLLRDLLSARGNILLLGKPGSGKTTVIRDIAATLSRTHRTFVIDTSNEIGGDGDRPHPCLALARRMQIKGVDHQDAAMIECVQNHSPEVIVVDEIGRRKEANAARIIAQRGVRVVATAHGSLSTVIQDALISDLLGGSDHVLLGDQAALQRGGQKIQQQRKQGSVFQVVVELSDLHTWAVFTDIEAKLDQILRGEPYEAHVRRWDPHTGRVWVRTEIRTPAATEAY